ncbi:ABC transporter ATP-binding protein [Leucobacter chinensis]|uniref:ABC transporter ATP-binding protein n=1 Tax=Leucobacter chinensis TaxID=2851010 RepID=UPI001C236603
MVNDIHLHRGSGDALLEVENLRVSFGLEDGGTFTAVDGLTFSVPAGKAVGLVGESGCGKSVTSLAIMGLLPQRSHESSGSIRFAGEELLGARDQRLRDLRGEDMTMVFQDPLSSLNPVIPIGVQVREVLERHKGMSRRVAAKRAEELLAEVGIPDPRRRMREYPHELSGGMRQRVLIAIALACEPKLLIADEPTTALDVTIQAQILELLQRLVTDNGTALLLITHDLGVVAGMCDEVNVLYGGKMVEHAQCHDLFATPRHPYTQGLLDSLPRLSDDRSDRLRPIPGSVADNLPWANACAFAPRCANATEACRLNSPETTVWSEDHLFRCFNPVAEEAS